jgi:hypothetical protein
MKSCKVVQPHHVRLSDCCNRRYGYEISMRHSLSSAHFANSTQTLILSNWYFLHFRRGGIATGYPADIGHRETCDVLTRVLGHRQHRRPPGDHSRRSSCRTPFPCPTTSNASDTH